MNEILQSVLDLDFVIFNEKFKEKLENKYKDENEKIKNKYIKNVNIK